MGDPKDGSGRRGEGAPKAAAAAPRPAATKRSPPLASTTTIEESADLPALFWDAMPDDAEAHPDFLALQALAEESTPAERAENFKVQGNDKVKLGLAAKNRHVLREAVDLYGKGAALRCGDADVNGALLSNRAHVQLLLGNWRHALRDAEAAAALRPADAKARHRACRAALELGELARAAALLRGCGLEVARGAAADGEEEQGEEDDGGAVAPAAAASAPAAPAAPAAAAGAGGGGGRAGGAAAAAAAKTDSEEKKTKQAKTPPPPPPAVAPLALLPPLPPLDAAARADFEALARRLLDRRVVLARERARDRAARERALRPARELARALLGRGVRMAAPAVNRVGSKSARPRLCPETSALRWPVVFMYPEAPHAPDVVEDAGEDDLIADHLDVVSLVFSAFCFLSRRAERQRVACVRPPWRLLGPPRALSPVPPSSDNANAIAPLIYCLHQKNQKMFAADAPPLEWEREAAAAAGSGGRGGGSGSPAALAASRYTRYTRSAVELYYVAGAGRPLVAEGAPLEEREEALAHALHWGWPEEQDEDGGAASPGEEEEREEDAAGFGALARREAGGARTSRRRGAPAQAAAAKPRFARLEGAEALTVGEALRLPGHVVAGVPVFWVVARGTEYHARWLREAPIVGHP